MRIKSLHWENIGPFVEADLEFLTDADDKPPVVLITGENGTGKSIILDAIRGVFGSAYTQLERDIRRSGAEAAAHIAAKFLIDGDEVLLSSVHIQEKYVDSRQESVGLIDLPSLPYAVEQGRNVPRWVVDYWSSVLANGTYRIDSLRSPEHHLFLRGTLEGRKNKADIIQMICHFDYLRSSDDVAEATLGKQLYSLLRKMIEASLLAGGSFSHVARSTYDPMVIQNGQLVSLAQLSSGNFYMIQNLVHLLGKMYTVQFLGDAPVEELCLSPGLLLIDEAENQLHPKWQKRLIRTVQSFFPNLQIIATTHSPFIISSVENARLFICKVQGNRCIVVDETAEYSNKPVDEILMSPLFEETQPFNEQITQLLEERKRAIEAGDERTRTRVEEQLKSLNPEYFGYLELDQLIADVTNGKVHA